ncbi:MAG: Ig-like domain-containing protein, partial [Bacteroidota bacterium]
KYSTDLFKDETEQLTATAYNAEGEVNDVDFSWSSANTNIATVSSSGVITPERTGETTVSVSANGIRAHCEVLVNPDTLVIVSPLYKDMEQGESHQFEATAYELSRSGLGQTYDIDFNWFIPDYGPGFEMFNIATVDDNGNVTVEQDAMMGMSTVLIAHDPANEYVAGGAMIMVNIGMPY